MNHLRRIYFRFRSLFTNSQAEEELDKEIKAHLALLEDDFVQRGMSADEARLAARRAYGGVEQAKQLHRDERSFQGLAQTVLDIRYTFRQLRKSSSFTATAVLTLALGIGATTAIFSIVEGVLLRPLPFYEPQQLVVLSDLITGQNTPGDAGWGVTAPDVRAYSRDTHSFVNLGGYQATTYEISGMGDPAEVHATRMTGGVFPTLGIQPILGRVFTEQEDEQDQRVVVLSSLWCNWLFSNLADNRV